MTAFFQKLCNLHHPWHEASQIDKAELTKPMAMPICNRRGYFRTALFIIKNRHFQ